MIAEWQVGGCGHICLTGHDAQLMILKHCLSKMSVLPAISYRALAKTFSANAHLHIDGGLELLDVLVERLCLSPASLCQVCVLVHNANVVEALSMPDEVDNLHTHSSQ